MISKINDFALFAIMMSVLFQLQILLFPEGTNLTDDTKASSMAYAKKNNLPFYEYTLHPRSTGFSFMVKQMRKSKYFVQQKSK